MREREREETEGNKTSLIFPFTLLHPLKTKTDDR